MTVGTTLTSDELRESFSVFAENLRTSLSALDEEIADLEAKLVERKALRKQAVSAIRLADPSFEADAKPGPKTKTKHPTGSTFTNTEKLNEVREWLEAHRDALSNGDGFTARTLVERDDFDVVSRSYLSIILNELHDRGVLTLTRRGMGGAKVFTLS